MASKRKEFEQRLAFLQTYSAFDKWLRELGFRSHYSYSATVSAYHYSTYDELMEGLYGVEVFVHEGLRYKLQFMRDRNQHRFMVVDSGAVSAFFTLEEMKEVVTADIVHYRDEKLLALGAVLAL